MHTCMYIRVDNFIIFFLQLRLFKYLISTSKTVIPWQRQNSNVNHYLENTSGKLCIFYFWYVKIVPFLDFSASFLILYNEKNVLALYGFIESGKKNSICLGGSNLGFPNMTR